MLTKRLSGTAADPGQGEPAWLIQQYGLLAKTPQKRTAPLTADDAERFLSIGPATSATKPSAIIVVHGMGQQVRFETLEDVANALVREQVRLYHQEPDVHIEAIAMGSSRCYRAALTLLTGPQEAPGERAVHIYECYWAPSAEGQISAFETFVFLIMSGWRGLWNSQLLRFTRYSFGRFRTFALEPSVWLQLGGTLAALVALALIAAVAGYETVRHLLHRPLRPIDGWLATDAGVAIYGAVLSAFGIASASVLRRLWSRAGRLRAPDPLVRFLFWVPAWAGLLVITLAGITMAYQVAAARSLPGWVEAAFPHGAGWVGRASVLPAGAWILVAAGAWAIGEAVRQYVGDVAIYVSTNTVNRFEKVRKEIVSRCLEVARHVYERRLPDNTCEYDDVMVVAHSLGSVIAYDILNDLLLEDDTGAARRDVAGRTKTMITFGSPLDKIAFLFRTQRDHGSSLREKGAASAQPLICDYRFRPQRWVNIHAGSDWISGSLDYFDDYGQPAAATRAVVNLTDPQAFTPFMAHTHYWKNHMLPAMMHHFVAR